MSFYFAYTGSKRLDMKFINQYINLDKVKTIVEPFCGSSAFSFYCYDVLKYEKLFHINDLDKQLIDFIKLVKEKNGIKYFTDLVNGLDNKNIPDAEVYKKRCNDPIYGYFYARKCKTIRVGLKPLDIKRYTIKNKGYEKLDSFYLNKKLEISNLDFKIILNKYKNDKTAFLFLDPPYFSSFNSFYISNSGKHKTDDHILVDTTKMYIDILDFIKEAKCKVLLIINSNAITNYIYKDYIKGKYNKTYQMTKNKTEHIVICNY